MSVVQLPLHRTTQTAPDLPCPRFCTSHTDGVHAGNPSSTFMVDTTGRRAQIHVWMERRDQADGSTQEVAVLSLDGREFDMPAGRLYLLAQQMEETFWTATPKRGDRFDTDPPETANPEPRLTVVAEKRPAAATGQFAKRLTELLERDGRSFRKLGAAVHADPGYINKVANGERPVPGPDLVAALDRTLSAEGELVRIARVEQPPVDARARRRRTSPLTPALRQTHPLPNRF